MKRNNANIDQLVQELRQDQSDAGIEQAVQAFAPAAQTRSTGKWAWRTIAVAGALSLVAVGLMIPQRSVAAESFTKLALAQRASNVMFHIQPYDIDRNGATKKIWSGYMMGKLWRYVQSDYEQASDGERLTVYVHGQGQLMATTELTKDKGMGMFLETTFLDSWLKKDLKDLKLEHGVMWRGRKVDKYVKTFPFTDEKGAHRTGVSTLYADPVRNLPLYFEDIYSPTKGNALEWTYFEPARPDLLRIKLPEGLKVRDVTGQRKAVPQGEPETAKASG